MADQTAAPTSTPDNTLSGSGTASAVPAPHPATQIAQTLEPLPEDGDELEADISDAGDSAYGDSYHSASTSIRSSIIEGLVENGRRYQVVRETGVNIPSDDKQFGSMEAGHMAYTILESQRDNPYFRSKLSPNAQRVLDLGTGQGGWAIGVADMFPNLTVHGVDLYPPPQTWVPPNCILEVDDITKPWTWSGKFDLVHIRMLCGSLPAAEWEKLYQRAYDNLAPGGWIEHSDTSIPIECDDGSLPEDSLLARYGEDMGACAEAAGNTVKVNEMMHELIEKAGFVNIHDRQFKFPIGDWPKHPVYKEAGLMLEKSFKEGLHGWVMWALTKYGLPKPWSQDEVTVYVAKLRQELDQKYHIYQYHRRCWAQKPYDEPKAEQQPGVENVEPANT